MSRTQSLLACSPRHRPPSPDPCSHRPRRPPSDMEHHAHASSCQFSVCGWRLGLDKGTLVEYCMNSTRSWQGRGAGVPLSAPHTRGLWAALSHCDNRGDRDTTRDLARPRGHTNRWLCGRLHSHAVRGQVRAPRREVGSRVPVSNTARAVTPAWSGSGDSGRR